MLVLSRRVEESILIDGQKIEVCVLGCRGGRVKLGIKAPREIAVIRSELSRETVIRSELVREKE